MEPQPELAESASSAAPPARFLRGLLSVAWARLAAARPDLTAAQAPDPWLDRATAILAHNLATGRFTSARPYQGDGLDEQATLLSYAGQVLQELLAEFDLLQRLERGDSATWAAVIAWMERLSYHWLGPVRREEWAAWEAREITGVTCADLWQWLQEHPYPFDVPFERWAARALLNRLREASRRRALLERHVVGSLDRAAFRTSDSPTMGELLVDDSLTAWLEQSANREALLQALERLDERQRRIVTLWYLEGVPADEIAATLGLSVGNVYVLRFRAIEKLRKFALADERLGLTDALSLLETERRRSRPALELQTAQEGFPR